MVVKLLPLMGKVYRYKMDPRHPEQAVSRLRELMKQYDRIEEDIKKATIASQLGQLEREGGLVVQEICLVAPRIHEAMMQTSRQRRHDLSHGIAFGYTPEEKVGEYTKATIGMKQTSASGGLDEKEEAEWKTTEEKPKKKTTRKKKTTKKADK